MSVRDSTFIDCWAGVALEERNQGCDILVAGNEFSGTMARIPSSCSGERRQNLVQRLRWPGFLRRRYAVMLLGSGSEVYEDLTGRPDLSVFGDPTTNTIVTDYCCGCDPRGRR